MGKKAGSGHEIYGWLQEAGYTNQEVADSLRIGMPKFRSAMVNPEVELTMLQMMKIALMVDKKLEEVICSIAKSPQINRHNRKWFEENYTPLKMVKNSCGCTYLE